MSKRLQVISLTVPWPANYGGVIDIYYRLASIQKAGIEVDLHCFQYDRKTSDELEKVCNKVYYYPRKTSFLKSLGREPYITASRSSTKLQKNINASDCPILMEGIHCTHLLHTRAVDPSRCFVRIHNIEHRYYRLLADAETNPLRKFYFRRAATKLENFEDVYSTAAGLACISASETAYYSQRLGSKAFHLPAFHPYEDVTSRSGKGEYVLYHGNLSIAENHKAAMYLLKEVAVHNDFPLIIAGKSPRRDLVEESVKHPGVRIFANPSTEEMEALLVNAHIHVLPTFQDTGVKLKLLSALFRGRHVVTNPAMVEGTGLDSLVTLAKDSLDFRSAIIALLEKEVSTEMLQERSNILQLHFNNQKNTGLLLNRLGI